MAGNGLLDALLILVLVVLCALIGWLIMVLTATMRQDREHRDYVRLNRLLHQLGHRTVSFPVKMAAAHELRRFPGHSELILRSCERLRFDTQDQAALALKEELDASLAVLRGEG